MNFSNYRSFGILALFVAYLIGSQSILAASGSKAGNRKQTFMALSYSVETGSYGYATKKNSKVSAIQSAKRECRKHATDCIRKHIGFTNLACISIATSKSGGYGMYYGTSKNIARQGAKKHCLSYKGNNICKVLVTVCQ